MSRQTALERLRARYDQLAAQPEQTVLFPVAHGLTDLDDKPNPEHVGLIVEYRELDWQANQKITDKYASDRDDRARLYEAAEKLASACVNVHIRDDGEGVELRNPAGEPLPGRWTPVADSPAGYMRAARELGLEAETALEAVFAVLRSDWEVQRHWAFLGAWEPDGSQEVDAQFVGESPATGPSPEN